MRYIWQHIDTIISSYNGGVPLTHYLKNYYKLQPKLGSRDRKILSEMAYSWYRCEKGIVSDISFEEKMRICLFICNNRQKYILSFLPLDWEDTDTSSTEKNLQYLAAKDIDFDIERLFPFSESLSNGISKNDWLHSMLVQPDLFIRVRKNTQKITALLEEQNIPYKFLNEHCLALPNGAAIDKLLPEDSYVIQDASSQATSGYFDPKPKQEWYDCCSGAGGKSLLLKDIEPAVNLTVSDKRESILHNLKERFKQYRHQLPKSIVLDAADKQQLAVNLLGKKFDNIICDVPCSGSGTWARTPEQLYFFEEKIVDTISALQKQIATNVASCLKEGGKLFYITCSVFERENDEVVHHILKNTNLQLEQKQLINGIDKKADSMFIAVFSK
ncbi:MAG: RsmB/NOP family class I SAM-dependent RNA methyltransferase [Sphingobacteriales bacterium]|nr:MAG: RsmB/NOP family class I SAM-dependent RNA methyltransferase [Sphingobacteriales bacterium]